MPHFVTSSFFLLVAGRLAEQAALPLCQSCLPTLGSMSQDQGTGPSSKPNQ